MNNKFPQKQNTSEKLKAKQYGAAALICILVAVIMTVIRPIWGSVMLGSGGDKVPLGMVIFAYLFDIAHPAVNRDKTDQENMVKDFSYGLLISVSAVKGDV